MKILVTALVFLFTATAADAATSFIRINQAGYRSDDNKVAVAFSNDRLEGRFTVWNARGVTAMSGKIVAVELPDLASPFRNYYQLDFSRIKTPGRYTIELPDGSRSAAFTIGPYPHFQEDLLFFMRQQRCGYNPYLDSTCHLSDGRSVYAPFPDGTFVDAVGGWHDAGDQLKYLITASNATARMMLAYELERSKFGDSVDALGHDRPNGIPDILDEAYWGLVWIHKLHAAADLLIHQVADDRDHRGFKLPAEDNADYGWGANSFRPAYFADGKPQGLGKWKSRSTGVANIAGRSAAAMAMAYRIWKVDIKSPAFATKCLKAARELYEMGRRQEGFQQGNSFGAPYRYNEITWADDMEYAAAELYKATREPGFLADAKRYAALAGSTSWMEYESSDMGEQMSRHYEMYPFTNVGHFALYSLVDPKTKRELAGYYRSGIERIAARGRLNPYGVGVPFIWCSNNLVVAYVTQVHLYELMTGDRRFHASMLAHRDWLLGNNPWGTSMFEGLPAGGEYPEDTHLPTVQILKKQVRGGLVDGPIATSTYKGLIGLKLTQPDEFADLQPRDVVYHDDVGDYSTNEPTMDGTADAILMMAMFSGPRTHNLLRQTVVDPRLKYDRGGIIRGDAASKRMALVFTGDEFAEGGTVVADALRKHNVKASFFLTGRFYRTAANRSIIKRLKMDGHYLGPHSDRHLLYADWNDRSRTLVTREQFESDLDDNLTAMQKFGIERSAAPYFLPPYEWYNREIVEWASAMGRSIVNFTPGTRSNADYTTDDDKNYISSEAIMTRIKEYEAKDPNGLNGFILLTHIGSGPKRTDKFSDHIYELITWLRSNGYKPVRIDQLLETGK
ncbi:MAG TPA: glycoside hydrolase family 9 protein [Pyrinomonadaceae bacterium]|nr:glycoside hydrolase family 9 protein [Chloracidobacterium sp.]MBP9934801.1 glycoside hydrolase family 9 protein [Pyrinomonadaceae bacterium]MBK7803169.1 glycoside hydrolase family 9 protein [Chloracidobacterium sp.]MBL0240940.1 glycoside hydrolase family 9 protein [Chloracidobacterium sp.]HQX55171.1 glycoside hydrolase family 9 protein [Pyrinomonadaceae bacterium]